MKLGIWLTKGLNLMSKGLITNLNHKNSFVRESMLVFVCMYPIKKIFYLYISGFFHKNVPLEISGPRLWSSPPTHRAGHGRRYSNFEGSSQRLLRCESTTRWKRLKLFIYSSFLL
ncbi:hypothetical protein Hdeb2414_s0002g00073791 [Helianthus debilis subsp. tardiflorus]